MDIIKSKVNKKFELFSEFQKKKFIENIYKSIIPEQNITANIFPIHYLFDGYLNNKIGNTDSNVNLIRQTLILDMLFDLETQDIISVPHPSHSTKIYKFNHSNNYYIYYSNSGFGAENHIIDNTNMTISPKIYKISDSQTRDYIINYISLFLNKLKNVNYFSFIYKTVDNKQINDIELYFEELQSLKLSSQLNLTLEEFNKICKIIDENKDKRDENLQQLIYTLFNYIISCIPSKIQEVSFAYLINNNDDKQFTDNINRLNKTSGVKNIIDFFNNKEIHNKKINEEIFDIGKTYKKENKRIINLINEINKKLKTYTEPTIKFKLNDFKLSYNDLYGICNSLQKSGSCTFYSYYNLGINMKILELYNSSKSIEVCVNEFVNKFIEFHYNMVYLFALSIDIRYIPQEISKFTENNFYNFNYIYKIIKENDLLDEIILFYNEPTFLYNNYNHNILRFELNGELEKFNFTEEIKLNVYHNELEDYVNKTLILIRNKKIKNNIGCYKIIKYQLEEICLKIIISLTKNVDLNKTHLLFSVKSDIGRLKKYYYTMCEIYWIYFVILIKIYHNDIKNYYYQDWHYGQYNEKKYYDKEENKYYSNYGFLYFDEIPIEDEKDDKICLDKKDRDYNGDNLNPFYLLDPILTNLNRDELINILNYINDLINTVSTSQYSSGGFIQKTERVILEDLGLIKHIEYCKYIRLINLDKYEYNFLINEFTLPLNKSYDDYPINLIYPDLTGWRNKLNFLDYLNNIYVLVNKCHKIIENKYINDELKDKYFKIKENLINNFRLNFKKYIIEKDKDKDKFYYDINNNFNKISILLSNFKYYFINQKPEYYLSLLKSDTRIFVFNTIIYNGDINIFKPFFQNPELYETEYFINSFMNISDKIKWIGNLGISINKDNTFTYLNKTYFSLKYKYDVNNFNGLRLSLYRFGFSFNDLDKYLFLINSDILDRNNSIKDRGDGKILLLNNIHNNCIEINIKDKKINLDECYIFDKTNKDYKYKIILDYDYNLYPFLKLIPETSPYLLYESKNNYFINIILSNAVILNDDLTPYKITFIPKELKIPNIFELYQIRIAPSLLFPNISTLNIDLYEKLNMLYNDSEYNLVKYIDNFNKIFKSNDFVQYNDIIKKIKDLLKQFINIDDKKIVTFKNSVKRILEKDKTYDYTTSVDNFLNEYRLCSLSDKQCTHIDGQTCISIKSSLLIELDKIKKSLSKEKNIDDFIHINFDKFIHIMILTILVNILDSYINPSDITCWDIQNNLNIINNIQNFIQKINDEYFYFYEILFLLQNDYVFSKAQLDKYKIIQNELKTNNTELKLHQFMMGKGKTSVFTPLLAFSIKLLKEKQPTIITASHLVKDTKQLMILTEKILSSDKDKFIVNVFSDFDAKKRWIENTDITFNKKINLENEYNIIDEFDSHHNYLQSMFNYVIDEENFMNFNLMLYIYLYVSSIMKKDDIKIDEKQKIDNILNNDIFNKYLKNTCSLSDNMIYNKDYGFESIIFNKYDLNIICSPFSRKDTPIVGSNFSNLLLRLILTFKTYLVNFDMKLQEFDFKYLEKNKKIIISLMDIKNILNKTNNEYIKTQLQIKNNIDKLTLLETKLGELDLDIKKENYIKIKLNIIFQDIYKDCTPFIKLMIILIYLYEANIKYLNITKSQLNMSFQDLIYNTYNQWQVGYTGTAYLKLNDYNKYNISKNVFKEIIQDPDEKIEILLALEQYGKLERNKEVLNIKKSDNISTNIDNILLKIGDKPRGIVDLAGLFLDYENENIAKILQNKLTNKRIIFFNKYNEPLEYNNNNNNNNNNNIKYRGIHDDNFYYYDQAHTVGTDVKQPQFGHFAIIINKNIRMTDFAQAIFRFRKLNRGTYLSVINIHTNSTDILNNNDNVFELLNLNENKFQQNQELGLKYQLLKTIVRNKSKNYKEDFIRPLYLKDYEINKDKLIEYVEKNIIDLKSEKDNKLKNELLLDKNYEKLKEIIFENTNETQTETNTQTVTQKQQETETQTETNTQSQQEIEKIINKDAFIKKFNNEKIYIVTHLDCVKCKFECGYRLFNESFKISEKEIFISYNILNSKNLEKIDFNNLEKTSSDRLSFIEFDKFILIEIEYISIKYYIDRVPVYDFNGYLLQPSMYNRFNNKENRYILKLNPICFKILGIPVKDKNSEDDIKTAIDNLTGIAKIILTYHYLICKTDRYIIHNYLFNKIKTLNLDYKINEFADEKPEEPIFDIFDILNNIIIKLDYNATYEEEIKKIDEITDKLRDDIKDKKIFLPSWSWRDANKNKLYEKIRDLIQNIFKSLNKNSTKILDIYKDIINKQELFDIFNEFMDDIDLSKRIIDYLNSNFENFKKNEYNKYEKDLNDYNTKLKKFNTENNTYKLKKSNTDYMIYKDSTHNLSHEIFKIKSYWNTHKNNIYLYINKIEIEQHNFIKYFYDDIIKYFYDDFIKKPITMIENFIYDDTETISGGFNYYKKYLKYKNKYIKLKHKN